MPRVPTVASPSVEPTETRLPSVPRNLGVDASGLGQGLLNASQAMQRAEDELASIRLAEADTEFTNRLNSRLYADDDAYFRRLGKDAVTTIGDTQTEIDSIRDEVAESLLKTGAERRLFGQQAARRIEAQRVRMAAHAEKEQRAWDMATSQSRISSQVEAVNLNPSFDAIAEAVTPVVIEAAKIANDRGLPAEAVQEYVLSSRSSVYLSAVQGALVQDDIAHAQAVFERFDEHMTADDRAAAKRAVSVALKSLKTNNEQAINDARQAINGIEESLKRGWIPEDLQDVGALVQSLDDDTTTNQWNNATRFLGQVAEFAGMDFQVQREVLSDARSNRGGGTAFGALLVDQLEGVFEYQSRLVKEDPFRLYIEKNQGSLPDLRTPEGLNQARQIAEKAEREFGVEVLPVTKPQLDQMSRNFEQAGAAQRVRTAGSLVNGLGPTMASRMFRELDSKTALNIGVMGGMMLEGQNETALMIANGTERLRDDPTVIPQDRVKGTLDSIMGAEFGGAGSEMRRAMDNGIMAVYAELSKAAGDFSQREEGIVDEKRLQTAVNLVTGGLVEYEGLPLVTPVRGVTDDAIIEDWVAELTPDDFASVAGHDPDKALNRWLAHGKLESVGRGRYRPYWVNSNGTPVGYKVRPEGEEDTAWDELPDFVLEWSAPEAGPRRIRQPEFGVLGGNLQFEIPDG